MKTVKVEIQKQKWQFERASVVDLFYKGIVQWHFLFLSYVNRHYNVYDSTPNICHDYIILHHICFDVL